MATETDSPSPSRPSHAGLVADLKALRPRGLAKLHGLRLPALRAAAVCCGLCADSDEEVPAGIEELLRWATRWLGEADDLGRAAAASFGLARNLRGAAAQSRRKKAAEVYGITPETFRKKQEFEVIEQLAQAVLALCREHGPRPAGPFGATGVAGLAGDPPRAAPPRAAGPVRQSVRPELRDDPAPPFTVMTTVAHAPVPFTLHVCPVDLLRDIDILVSSENVYLEMARTFSSTISGALRRAGAVRNATGELVDDVLARELSDWVRRNARPGLQVRPGTVAPTSSGALAAQGVRRIYHAAVAVPAGDGDGSYEVAPGDIARAVRETFALAREEREEFRPPLSSLCFPLMGAGHGGVPPRVSARWIAWAVHEELNRDPRWTVHLVTRNRATARAIADDAP